MSIFSPKNMLHLRFLRLDQFLRWWVLPSLCELRCGDAWSRHLGLHKVHLIKWLILMVSIWIHRCRLHLGHLVLFLHLHHLLLHHHTVILLSLHLSHVSIDGSIHLERFLIIAITLSGIWALPISQSTWRSIPHKLLFLFHAPVLGWHPQLHPLRLRVRWIIKHVVHLLRLHWVLRHRINLLLKALTGLTRMAKVPNFTVVFRRLEAPC